MDEKARDMWIKIGLVLLFVVFMGAICSSPFRGIGGGGGSRGGGGSSSPDLADAVWDMYFECTARQRAGGYGLLEAANRCEKLMP